VEVVFCFLAQTWVASLLTQKPSIFNLASLYSLKEPDYLTGLC